MAEPQFALRVLMMISGTVRGENANDHFYLRLAKELRAHGGQLLLYTYEPPPESVSTRFREQNVEIFIRSPSRGIAALRGADILIDALRLGRRLKPQLLVGQYSTCGNVVALAGQILGIPSIKVVRATSSQVVVMNDGRQMSIAARLRQFGFHMLASRTVAVSDAVKRDLMEMFFVPAGRITLLRNAVDPDDYKPTTNSREIRRELDIPAEGFLLFAAAVFLPVKGHEFLLRSLAAVQRRDVYLALAGDGPLLQECQQLSRMLGISSRVRFLGRRCDVPDLLAAANCAVLPSLSDPFPLFLLEAMAAQRPVIATSVDGIPEIVASGQTGLLVSPSSVSELTHAIERLATDENLAREMGIAGYHRLRGRFDMSSRVDAELALYRELTRC